MRRYLILAYGVACYVMFLGVSLYLAGFLLNVGVPKGLDRPIQGDWTTAVAVDSLLVLLFGLQHSVMARPRFKRWWTQYIPEPAERSTYVLCSNLVLMLLFWQWRPLGPVVWEITHPVGWGLVCGAFGLGWLTVLGSSYLINHFDLFGLRQVWLHFRGRPYRPLQFATPGPYKLVRHPLYVGWTIVFWATPTMTAAHLLFAVGMTVYMLVAIRLEERNLLDHHGEAYAEYRRRTPMLLPVWQGRPVRGKAGEATTG